MSKYSVEWDNVFITGEIEDNSISDRNLCASALFGWANCGAGFEPPKKFGEGIVAIGIRLGISPNPENLIKLAEERGWLKATKSD